MYTDVKTRSGMTVAIIFLILFQSAVSPGAETVPRKGNPVEGLFGSVQIRRAVDFYMEINLPNDYKSQGSSNDIPKITVMPGRVGQFSVFIYNNGPVNSTFLLEIVDAPAGWNTSFMINDMENCTVFIPGTGSLCDEEADPHASRMVSFAMPADCPADEFHDILVRATVLIQNENDDSPVFRERKVQVVSGITDELALHCDEMLRYTDPGKGETIEFYMTNVGSSTITDIRFQLVSDYSSGWKIAIPEDVESLCPGATKISIFRVRSPVTAMSWSSKLVVIEAVYRTDVEKSTRISYNIVVMGPYHSTIDIEPFYGPNQVGYPGGSVFYNLSFYYSNLVENVVMITGETTTKGMDIICYPSIKWLNCIDYFSTLIRIDIPEDTLAGNYCVSVNLSSLLGFDVLYLNVPVGRVHSVDLNVLDMGPVNWPDNGCLQQWDTMDRRFLGEDEGTIFQLMLTNKGNSQDIIELNLSRGNGHRSLKWNYTFTSVSNRDIQIHDQYPIPDCDPVIQGDVVRYRMDCVDREIAVWDLRDDDLPAVHTIYLELYAGQTVLVDVLVQSPNTRDPGSPLYVPDINLSADNMLKLYVEATCIGIVEPDHMDIFTNDSRMSVELNAHLKFPDLAFATDMFMTFEGGEQMEHDQVSFSARICNLGKVDVERVWVYLVVDGDIVQKTPVTGLVAMRGDGYLTERSVVMTTSLERGVRKVEMIIDNLEDDEGYIRETDEFNNYVQEDIEVRGYPRPPRDASCQLSVQEYNLRLLIRIILFDVAAFSAIILGFMLYCQKKGVVKNQNLARMNAFLSRGKGSLGRQVERFRQVL